MDQYIGEIRLFTGNYAPQGWAICDGRLLQINQNTALFAILGVTYGGDGKATFALPDLRGRVPIHAGTGNNLTPRRLGSTGGTPAVTLTAPQLASHSHRAQGIAAPGSQPSPVGGIWAQVPGAGRPTVVPKIYDTDTPTVPMNAQVLDQSGESQPHNNVQPALGLNYIIATQGIFPPRDY